MGEIAINPIHNVHKKYRQMNLVNHYIFAPPIDVSTNTYIGGVASSISTPALLATKLAIDVSRITNFSIVGSDIKCKITGSYAIPVGCFSANTSIAYFYDNEGLVASLGSSSFYKAINLLSVSFKNATSVGNQSFDGDGVDMSIRTIYTPSAINYGSSVANNTVFRDNYSGLKVYVSPSLSTCNSGNPDADLTFVISKGAQVNYVSNNTVPTAVNTLSSSIVYDTAIQLTFTAPSSTNAIDYYEVYVDGIFKNNIYSSGGYVMGLPPSTFCLITIIAVDIFLNKSIASNSINVSTNSTVYPYQYLTAYYKVDSNFKDNYRGYNAISTGVTYAAGKMGNAAVFNGSVFVNYAPIISYGSFTISAWIKTTSSSELFIFSNKSSGSAIIGMEIESGKFFSRLRSSAGTGITSLYSTVNVNNGVWRHVAMRFDIATGVQSNFVDGAFNSSVTYTGGYFGSFQYSTFGVEASASPSYGKFNGSMDGLSFFNSALTNAEMTAIYNAQNSGLELIP